MKNMIPDAAAGRISTDTHRIDRAEVACPPWCTDAGSGDGCEGEHSSEIAAVPATGGPVLQYIVDRDWHAGYIPIASVRATYDQAEGDAPSISLYVRTTRLGDGASREVEVDLRRHEARALIKKLSTCLAMIEGDTA